MGGVGSQKKTTSSHHLTKPLSSMNCKRKMVTIQYIKWKLIQLITSLSLLFQVGNALFFRLNLPAFLSSVTSKKEKYKYFIRKYLSFLIHFSNWHIFWVCLGLSTRWILTLALSYHKVIIFVTLKTQEQEKKQKKSVKY